MVTLIQVFRCRNLRTLCHVHLSRLSKAFNNFNPIGRKEIDEVDVVVKEWGWVYEGEEGKEMAADGKEEDRNKNKIWKKKESPLFRC